MTTHYTKSHARTRVSSLCHNDFTSTNIAVVAKQHYYVVTIKALAIKERSDVAKNNKFFSSYNTIIYAKASIFCVRAYISRPQRQRGKCGRGKKKNISLL